MKATNLIKINGVWYRAGDELPADRTPVPVEPENSVGEPKITREEIDEMKYFALKSLAEKKGISVKEKNANRIRMELIEAMGL